MKRFIITLTLASTSLLFTRSALSAPMIPKMNEPTSYKDFRFGLNEMRQNIESVSCGGWHDEPESAGVSGTNAWGEMPYPFISPDIPGRENKMPALSKATTGLDERTEFAFPDSAFGYLSACNIYDPYGYDEDLKRLGLDIIYDDVPVDGDPNPRVVPGSGRIHINPYNWCIRMEKATPRWCEKLFKTWQRMADIAPRPWSNEFCKCPFLPPAPDAFCAYVPQGPTKRYCFDYAGAAPRQDATEVDGTPKAIESADWTKHCNGQECRTPWTPEFGNELIKCENWYPTFDGLGNYTGHVPGTVYGGYDFGKSSSFYRHYGNPFNDWAETKQASQTPLTVTAPTFTWKVRGDCYEYYQAHLDYESNQWKELDPKDYVTSMYDEQCEFTILTNDEQNPEKPEWKDGGPNGEKQKDEVKAPSFDVEEPPRDPRPMPAPWVPDEETNLSMIDMERLRRDQRDFDDPSDITGILGALLMTRQRASKTVPKNARSDQFDDTDHRAIAKLWEGQQRELLKMTADPQTRLIMPARFLVGIADDDPIFQYVKGTVSKPDGTVELTIRAGAEDLANVVQSFIRIFVAPIQEVRIPVLVPFASLSEIESLIFQWRQWKEAENRAADDEGRPSKAGAADDLIDKLEDYRDDLEAARKIRGALPEVVKRLYDSQEDIRTYFADWFEEQADLFLLAIQRADQRRDLKRTWRLLQRSMLQTDECQMYYCSNHRYSTPIYSLLDNWWGDPDVKPGQPRDPDYIPPYDLRTLGYVQPPDQVFDFSNMKFSNKAFRIPVLTPVSVKIVLPSPPLLGVDPPDPDDFPDLPDLPDEHVFDSFTVPDVDLSEKPTITLPPTDDLTQAITMLRELRKIIDGTPIDIQVQEENDLKTGVTTIDDGGFPPDGLLPNRLSMRSGYCRFQPSILIPPDPEQRTGNPARIIHTENDLKERLGRLFARWMPQRTEDWAGRVARRNEDFPPPETPKCHEDVVCYFLPPEVTTRTSWQWFMPDQSTSIFNSLARQMKDDTLPPDQPKKNPYFNASREVLELLFSRVPLPLKWDLVPPPPTTP